MATYFSGTGTLTEDASTTTEQFADDFSMEFPLSECNVLISCTFYIDEQDTIENMFKTIMPKLKQIFSSSVLFDNITSNDFVSTYVDMDSSSYEDVIANCKEHLNNSIGTMHRFAYFGATFNKDFVKKPMLVLKNVNKLSSYMKQFVDNIFNELDISSKKEYSIMISLFKPKTKMHFVDMTGAVFYSDYVTELLLTLGDRPEYMLNEFGIKQKRIESGKNLSEENRKMVIRALLYGDGISTHNGRDFYMEPIETDYRHVIDMCWTMIPWIFKSNFRKILQSSTSQDDVSPDFLYEAVRNCNERIPALITFCLTSEKTEFGIFPLVNIVTESGTVLDSDIKIDNKLFEFSFREKYVEIQSYHLNLPEIISKLLCSARKEIFDIGTELLKAREMMHPGYQKELLEEIINNIHEEYMDRVRIKNDLYESITVHNMLNNHCAYIPYECY